MFVYLIQSRETGLYKIGVAKNPKKRLTQLQTGNGGELRLIDQYQSDEYAFKIERTLHRHNSHERKEGEWFDLCQSYEAKFISRCKIIENGFIEIDKSIDILNII